MSLEFGIRKGSQSGLPPAYSVNVPAVKMIRLCPGAFCGDSQTGLDRYTSLAAGADGGRVVATLADPKRTSFRTRE